MKNINFEKHNQFEKVIFLVRKIPLLRITSKTYHQRT